MCAGDALREALPAVPPSQGTCIWGELDSARFAANASLQLFRRSCEQVMKRGTEDASGDLPCV